MKQKEIFAYLAGIIDGEGTITITKHAQHGRPTFQYKPMIIVSSTDERLMKYLLKRFGGTIRVSEYKTGNRRDAWIWRVMSLSDIERILCGVYEFLVIKKSQAKIMRMYLESRGKRSDYGPIENRCHETIRALNVRGRRFNED